MAVFARLFNVAPKDYWDLRIDEANEFRMLLKLMAAKKGT
jgi:hypothetical protein